MDFVNDNGSLNLSEGSDYNQPNDDKKPVPVINGPDDVDGDTLHQILNDVESNRQDDDSTVEVPTESPIIDFSPPDSVIPISNIPKDEYEVFLPREFWDKNVVSELKSYGLPETAQPVDFFNYLIVHRDKLKVEDTSSKMVIDALIQNKKVEKKIQFKWVGLGIVLLIIIVFLFIFFKKSVKTTVSGDSWFQ